MYLKRLLQLSTVRNDHLLTRPAGFCAELSHLFNNIHAVSDKAKGNMLEIEVLCFLQGDEELGVVGVAAAVRHGQQARACVLHVKIFILKLLPEDGLPSCPILVGYVSTLAEGEGHK